MEFKFFNGSTNSEVKTLVVEIEEIRRIGF
jgi:hypothetical protein